MSGVEGPSFHAEALNVFLAWLDDDRDRAGEKFEQLRRKLTMYFEGRQCNPFAMELADRTLDIVARQIQEGIKFHVEDAPRYCYGVAQNIMREHCKRGKTEPLTWEPAVSSGHTLEREQKVRCLELCLCELPPEGQYLIREYYREEKRARIDHRQRLAEQIGISVNTLRIRAHQIRTKLEECVHRCLNRDQVV